MSEEEIRALKELEYDLKEHKTKYAKNYEDVCYNSLIKLQQENTQLKQQLKDKDELLEKIKNMSETFCSSNFIIQTYRLLHTDEERKLLESNKED